MIQIGKKVWVANDLINDFGILSRLFIGYMSYELNSRLYKRVKRYTERSLSNKISNSSGLL